MNSLNSILLEGNLVEDPKMGIHEKTETDTCFFRIASGRSYKDPDGNLVKEVDIFEVETWGKLAGVCKEYLTRGLGVRIVGRLKVRKWSIVEVGGREQVEDREQVVIMAEHVEFIPKKKVIKPEKIKVKVIDADPFTETLPL